MLITTTGLNPVRRFSAPTTRHQAVVLKLAAALLRHVESRKLGRVLQAPCDVVLSTKTVVQPDILFVQRRRRGIIGPKNLLGAPDLVVEILSRETQKCDLRAKKRIYAHFEVPEYWAVDADGKTIETHLWSELGYIAAGRFGRRDRVSSPLLPDLNLPLSRIFNGFDN